MTVRNPFDLFLRFNNNSVRAEDRSKSLRIIKTIKKENRIGTGIGKT